MIQPQPDYGILTHDEFVEEFDYRYRPGQHTIFLGPTGRGKTSIAGQLLTRAAPKHDGLLTIQIGHDPALQHLGKPTKDWPPPLPIPMYLYDEKPMIRRYQPRPRKPEHLLRMRSQSARILRWMFARANWALFIPDLQVVCDPHMMGLGAEVDQLLITLRKLTSSVWMDAQAPRWIPTASYDQTSHLIIWRNRNEDVMRKLKSIAGLDFEFMLNLLKDIKYHDFLWVDTVADEYFVVRNDRAWQT